MTRSPLAHNREAILDAIRRAAAANGGKPLGRDTFERETGIRPADWQGRYWARWSDAVREAGLEPNTLRGATDEEVLFRILVRLTRELGHLPTRYEVELARRSDPSVPVFTVFTRRLGPTQIERARKLLSYCERDRELEDVAEVCRRRIDAAPSRRPSDDATKQEAILGAVYLFKSGRHYKIGRTNAAGRRERELVILMPEKGETVHSITTDDPVGIEGYWHKRFGAKHKNGEWFELDAADVRAFKRRKFM